MKARMCALAIPVLLTLMLTAQAADARIEWANPELSFEGTTAVCSASCRETAMLPLGAILVPGLSVFPGAAMSKGENPINS